MTQPTLSAGVKQLEQQMGVLLVNRGSRFQGFTPEGQRVLEWARRIVGDTRSMREEINSLRHGLSGRLRIAAIPTALAMVTNLTTPYRERHPNVQFTVLSRNSVEVLDLLENLEIDAGITYVENEPLGRVNTVPLYHERYRLLTSADAPLGNRDSVTWSEVAQVPLCLLTPDMQNRRIIDRLLKSAGGELAADAGIRFDDPAVHPRAHRALGECHAGAARRNAGPHRYAARHSHHPTGSGTDHRPRRAVARTDDSADVGAGVRGTTRRRVARRLRCDTYQRDECFGRLRQTRKAPRPKRTRRLFYCAEGRGLRRLSRPCA